MKAEQHTVDWFLSQPPNVHWFLSPDVLRRLFDHLSGRVDYPPEEAWNSIEIIDLLCANYVSEETASEETADDEVSSNRTAVKSALKVLIEAVDDKGINFNVALGGADLPHDFKEALEGWLGYLESSETILGKLHGGTKRGAPRKIGRNYLIKRLWEIYPNPKKTAGGDFEIFVGLILPSLISKKKMPKDLHDVIVDALKD